MSSSSPHRRRLPAAAVALMATLVLADHAEARRGGSFGSRGARTYSAPRATGTAPGAAGPVQRSMTPNTGQPGGVAQRPGQAGAAGVAQPNRGGFMQRWGGPLLGGLALGGLLGMMMGHGFGGMAGFLGLLLQVGIIALIVMLAVRFFRRRRDPAFATSAGGPVTRDSFGATSGRDTQAPDIGGGLFSGGAAPAPQAGGMFGGGLGGMLGGQAQRTDRPNDGQPDEVGLNETDFDTFERLLRDVQTAFGREDYDSLRERTTPEIMSYLSEELSQNAVAGKRNEVREVRLVQGDLAEAWRDDDSEFATVAMRYESIDVTRDRTSGAVLDGDADLPTETTELWTFVRRHDGAWRLSAIQDTAGA